MSSDFDDSPLGSLVSGLVDETGRIRLEDFTQLICEQMGVSEEQASAVTQQLDPEGEGYIDVDLIYQAFRALTPDSGNGSSLNSPSATEEVDGGAGDGEEDDDDDDGPPPSLPDSPEPGMIDTLQPHGSPSSGPRAPSLEGEEFVGEVNDDDVMEGALSPVPSKSPRRTITSAMSNGSLRLQPSRSLTSIHSAELERQEAYHEEQLRQMSTKIDTLSVQLTAALEERDSSESLQRKTKQEYTSLQARVHHMEEQLREKEEHHQSSLRNAQEKQKLKLAQLENKLNLQISGMKAQLSSSQEETRQVTAQESTLRDQLKESKKESATLKEECDNLRKTLSKRESDQSALVAQQRRETEGASATIRHLQEQLTEVTQRSERLQKEASELSIKNQRSKNAAEESSMATQHMEEEVARLQKEVSRVGSRNNELSAQLIKQGKMLMEAPDGGKDPESLEAEMNTQSKDEIMKSLREERNFSSRLKEYVDNLLVVVMEQSPHLLEVRSNPTSPRPSMLPRAGT